MLSSLEISRDLNYWVEGFIGIKQDDEKFLEICCLTVCLSQAGYNVG